MLMRTKALLAATTATLLAGAAVAAPPTPVYLKKAGASDLYEKTSSQLVLGSSDHSVRAFAKEMIADHTQSTAKVKAAAMRAGLHPKPPMLEPKQRAMVADLRRAHGHQRDVLYAHQQEQAHQEALALHQEYASSGDVAPLRRTAGDIVPVVQHHIQMLGTLPH
jgi:putative membrane protein